MDELHYVELANDFYVNHFVCYDINLMIFACHDSVDIEVLMVPGHCDETADIDGLVFGYDFDVATIRLSHHQEHS